MTSFFGDRILSIKNESEFSDAALDVFHYQSDHNSIYKNFIASLRRDASSVKSITDIPFLPVEFFREHKIITGNIHVEKIFESSGTTGSKTGKHFICDLKLYDKSFLKSFRTFYGDPEEFIIIALLPSYTEREGSSLVYMVDNLIKRSNHILSGFYNGTDENLLKLIDRARETNRKVFLLGVSFALLDLAENCSHDLSDIIIMETGGMKGRRKEITRPELHSVLKERFNVREIHSEYGMTELLSQAYSKGDGIFYCPPWMKVVIRDPQDPLTIYTERGKTGGINIIDLANINSASFISTGDLGKLYEDGGFEVLGRFDNSDIRGCNLMAE